MDERLLKEIADKLESLETQGSINDCSSDVSSIQSDVDAILTILSRSREQPKSSSKC